jgi:hypothetical protein
MFCPMLQSEIYSPFFFWEQTSVRITYLYTFKK